MLNHANVDQVDAVQVLRDAASTYNERQHSYHGLSPDEASTLQDSELALLVEDKQKPRANDTEPQFAVGDRVRVQRKRRTFAHGDADDSLWSEVMEVSEVRLADGVWLYRLRNGETGVEYKDWN